MNNKGTFTVHGIDFPDGVDPLGIWQMQAIQAISFDVDKSGIEKAPDTSPMSVWCIQLPHDLGEADAVMESQLHHIDQQQLFLDKIDARLDVMDPNLPTHTPYVTSSYDPQTVLLDSIIALRLPSEAFSTGDTAVDYRALYNRCEVLINRFQQTITRRGRIETRIGDNLVGLTNIDWNGDFETIWEENAASLSMQLHVKSIRLASASRLTVLRILSIVSTGALGLAIKASIPGGQFLLIPAVYKFVRDMLEELKKIPVEG